MGFIKSRLAQCEIQPEVTFGYETKFKREQLNLSKTHANDAIAICLNDNQTVLPMNTILIKKHVAKGDYKQTAGSHSEKKVPTGKLFGFKKFDKVITTKGMGFIKGKRSSGYFSIADLDNNLIHASEKVKNCVRITARKTTLVEELTLTKLNLRRKEKPLTSPT